jgi:hypothetical protein
MEPAASDPESRAHQLLDFDGDQSVKQIGSDHGNGKGNSNADRPCTKPQQSKVPLADG